MRTNCGSCPIKRKRKSSKLDKILSWGVKIVLATILLNAAYEQFIKEPVAAQHEQKLTSK